MMSFRAALLNGTAPTFPVKQFGVSGRKTVAVTATHCGMLIERKSRYLRKDAQAFMGLKTAIEDHSKQPLSALILLRGAPLCSKAKALLNDNGITIEIVD